MLGWKKIFKNGSNLELSRSLIKHLHATSLWQNNWKNDLFLVFFFCLELQSTACVQGVVVSLQHLLANSMGKKRPDCAVVKS